MNMGKDILLSDNDLESVTGGARKIKFMKVACIHCGKNIQINVDASEAKCPFCKKINSFAG